MNKPKDIKDVVAGLIQDAGKTREYIDKTYMVEPHIIELVFNNDITERDFYHITSFLTPQARSPLWQNYFIEKIGAQKIPAANNTGDFLWKGKFYEHKISGFNKDKNLHVVQVRTWQGCDYIIQYLDEKHNPPVTFVLTGDEMKEELKLLKVSSAHGTKKANKNNENIEYRFTLVLDSKDWERWCKLYKTDIPG